MARYIQPGKAIEYTNAGEETIRYGDVVALTSCIGVAAADIAPGETGVIELSGVYEMPAEITDLPVGIVGLGTSGGMIAQAMQFMGAKVSYFSRTRKPDWEKNGFSYLPLKELLAGSQVVFTCLNKNVILLGKEEFEALGQGKILFNTSIGPSHEIDALSEWLAGEKNYFVCDTEGALGDPSGQLLAHPQVFCAGVSVGRTRQAFVLLSRKVLDNIRAYLGE